MLGVVKIVASFLLLTKLSIAGHIEDEIEAEQFLQNDEFDGGEVYNFAAELAKRQFQEPGYPGGDYLNGWKGPLPSATADNGTAIQKFAVAGGSIPVYLSNRVASQVTRAIIIPPGMRRDPWWYFTITEGGLRAAAKGTTDIKEEQISILSPMFPGFMDLTAGIAVSGNFVWNRTTWVSGRYNVNSDGAVPTKVSSFDVMDGLVDYYSNTTMFPNLRSIVIAGHSAGAQMVQRYLMLRTSTKQETTVQYWIGNPSSFAYLTTNRPKPNATCSKVDDWKYGLTDGMVGYATAQFERLGRAGMVARYLSRYTHYIWGTIDNLVGDTKCQAMTQGADHYARGQAFAADLQKVAGNAIPANTTIQYLPVWHDFQAIVNRAEGWENLFRFVPPGAPGGGNPPPTSSTTTTKTTSTTTTSTTTSTAPQPTQTRYGQCGGTDYHGPTVCQSPYTCTAVSPPYYYQCL